MIETVFVIFTAQVMMWIGAGHTAARRAVIKRHVHENLDTTIPPDVLKNMANGIKEINKFPSCFSNTITSYERALEKALLDLISKSKFKPEKIGSIIDLLNERYNKSLGLSCTRNFFYNKRDHVILELSKYKYYD